MFTTIHAPPQHLPAPRELDEVEFLRMKTLPPTTGFGPAESLLTLTIPTSLAARAAERAIVLLTPTGTKAPVGVSEHGLIRVTPSAAGASR